MFDPGSSKDRRGRGNTQRKGVAQALGVLTQALELSPVDALSLARSRCARQMARVIELSHDELAALCCVSLLRTNQHMLALIMFELHVWVGMAYCVQIPMYMRYATTYMNMCAHFYHHMQNSGRNVA